MKYKEVKEKLNSKGFELSFIQTGYKLEILSFTHSNIEGEIFVEFNDKNIELEDETEIDYDNSEFLMDIEIKNIEFSIDKFISYNPPFGSLENKINLCGSDIDLLFDSVLNIMTDKYYFINFLVTYHEKMVEFNNKIQKFFPIIDKYKEFDMEICKIGGNQNCLFSNIQVNFNFQKNTHTYISFEFSILSWKIDCLIGIFGEGVEFNINSDVDLFEKEIDNQIKNVLKFYSVLKEK